MLQEHALGRTIVSLCVLLLEGVGAVGYLLFRLRNIPELSVQTTHSGGDATFRRGRFLPCRCSGVNAPHSRDTLNSDDAGRCVARIDVLLRACIEHRHVHW